MNPLQRLLGYARPYRGRFVVATAAMVLYAAATAAVAALIRPVIDKVLPQGTGLLDWCMALLTVYFIKGASAYASTYLMTDIGQRVVRDLRDRLFRHIIDQSATFFSRR
ncbi:MAG: ABC transporter transmembrane domain-containing protein, partial [Acidobacteriota bacterium]|nr:ABC transporter transmembrane domain-containing protein [Acidobacteriota bacterium]